MSNAIELKQQAIDLINDIPDERTDILVKVVRILNELTDDSADENFSRAEQDLAIMEDIETLTREGGD